MHWDIETDAYIAAALTLLTINQKSYEHKDHPEQVAYAKLKDLFESGKPLAGPVFENAFKAVYPAVQKMNVDKKGLKFGDKDNKKRSGKSEAEIFKDLHDAALKAKSTP
jgi:hypothetical protein